MPSLVENSRMKKESGVRLPPLDQEALGSQCLNESSSLNLHKVAMTKDFWSLLVYDQDDPVRSLEGILISHGITTLRSHKCSETRAIFRSLTLPSIVMTDISLPDGTWEDVLTAARAVPVIVVSRTLNISLYLDVLEKGALDFVVPPFRSSDLAYIIRAANLKHSDWLPRSA